MSNLLTTEFVIPTAVGAALAWKAAPQYAPPNYVLPAQAALVLGGVFVGIKNTGARRAHEAFNDKDPPPADFL